MKDKFRMSLRSKVFSSIYVFTVLACIGVNANSALNDDYTDTIIHDSEIDRPLLELKDIKIDGNEVYVYGDSLPNKIHLSYTEESISFHVYVANTDLENNFSYELSGRENRQQLEADKDQILSYHNLKGGWYELIFYKNDEIIEKISFKIESPFWETGWFYSLLLAMISAFIILVYNARMSKVIRMRNMLEKQVEVRTKKLTEKTEELQRQKIKMQDQRDIANKLKAELSVEKMELEELRDQLTNVIDVRNSDNSYLTRSLERTKKELKQLEQDYDTLSENARDLILKLKLPDESYEFVSPSAFEITGYYPHEFYERTTLLKSIIHKGDLNTFLQARNKMYSGDMPTEINYRLVSKEGEVKWINQRNKVVSDENGSPQYLLAILRDNTKDKALDIQAKSKEKRENIAEIIKDKIATEDLTSNTRKSTEKIITEFAELILNSESISNEKQLYAEAMTENSELLVQALDDIIDLSRLESGQIEICKSNCYVNNLLQELYNDFNNVRLRLAKNDITLKLKLASEKENYSIYTDTHRLRQILLNIIGNALKYTQRGVIEFGYEIQDITDENEENKQNIIFFVKDTGIGINNLKIKDIFDPKSTFDYNKNKSISGIGLAISKKLVEMLEGRIWADSAEGIGTAFYISLPHLKQKGLKQQMQTKEEIKTYNWKNKTILVAEDEENNFKFIKAALKKTGVELIHAFDGLEALRIFKEKNKELNVVLMDIQMPKMNGYEATKAFVEINPNVPIIAQTAFAMSGGKIKCFDAGCSGYIAKPYKAKDLLDSIAKHIHHS